MKKIVNIFCLRFVVIAFCVFSFNSHDLLGQNLIMNWESILGGSSDEYAYGVVETSDGNIVYAGFTNSMDFYVNYNYGSTDGWIVKLNNDGDTIWTKTFGGSSDDYFYGIAATENGGVIAVGFTSSNDYCIHENKGVTDCWAICLNQDGDSIWSKTYGGSNMDIALSIVKTSPSEYVIGGFVASNDGDISGNHGGMDMWAYKIDSDGNLIWGKTIGGSGDEDSYDIKIANDDVIIIGSTNSLDGDFNSNEGGQDIAFAKLNSSGDVVFSNSYGANLDDIGYSCVQNEIGDIQICGSTKSTNGIFSENHGEEDAFVLCIDATGQLLWSKCFGGSGPDMAYGIIQSTNQSLLVSCETWSAGGQVSVNNGYCDIWLLQINMLGDIIFEESYGGAYTDMPCETILTTENTFIISGNSSSWDAFGMNDQNCWIFELEDQTTDVNTYLVSDENISIYPNPVRDKLTINLNTDKKEKATLELLNFKGQIIYKRSFSEIINLNMNTYPDGIYFLKIYNSKYNKTHKIVINR